MAKLGGTKGPLVLKFGGAALGRKDRVDRAIQMVKQADPPVVVVVSAREGITDRLKQCADRTGERGLHEKLLDDLKELHEGIPRVLNANIDGLKRELSESNPPSNHLLALEDSIMSRGERLSAHWFAHLLDRSGVRSMPMEADVMGLLTDGEHGSATIDRKGSKATIGKLVEGNTSNGVVPVITGFIGRGPDGSVTTLGRGGSDYTATSIGSMIGAREIRLVKTEASLFSADPKIVPDARPISRLTYEEAEELAQFGARVLHPLTVEPARESATEVTVASLETPSLFTTIGPSRGHAGVRAMTIISPVALLSFRVPGGRQKKGVISTVADLLSRSGINVVTLFTSSALLSIVVENGMGSLAHKALEPLVKASGLGATIEGPLESALVTAIGEGLGADIWRVPRDVLQAASGMSGTTRTLSIAVPRRMGENALREMHKALVGHGMTDH